MSHLPIHAPGHVRDAFLASVDAKRPDPDLVGRLWNCTDILPRSACDALDLPTGSTYAQAARQVRDRSQRR